MALAIPKTMKAAVAEKHNAPLVIKEVPVPSVEPDEVLVKIVASGICHSDLHIADGEMPAMMRLPLIPGHEGVGIVVKLGSAVKHLKLGERVAIGNVNSSCNACVECHEGRENHCRKYVQTGGGSDGCYCDYQKVHGQYAIKIPDGVAFTEAAPVACAGHTVYSAVRQIKQRPGTWVAVIGIGGLGHLAIQYATALGYQVIAIDVAQEKLDLGVRLGAKKAFSATNPKLASEVMKFTDGGCMGVIVTAVHESAFATSIKIARMNATCVWISLPSNPIQIVPKIVVFKALQITGVILGTRAELAEAYRLVANGVVKPIVETVSLDEINTAWNNMRAGKFAARTVIVIDPKLIDLKTAASAAQLKL
ncbi:alcohol dehydrogenase zinc-binding domain protein [Gonapodya prolifera JEL478]|uniref:Alcohol dehydrogenase zinc-binding domain protein n=1 Tax=Gonapodya prolifera (strain JEL478) TaxID=1344416 RepID=A0A139AHN5_GONPJ|nr:alcohol dehydrogenase zinc-binding domain protein [Gonapodya prolifera JEL478]|eukprot:KXS15945.1 alcohol dehydrogenase zinc-binding domain protein [Gonapodya prolifera JEL478]